MGGRREVEEDDDRPPYHFEVNSSSPQTVTGWLDFLFEAGDQFPIGGDEGLLGFDLGDDQNKSSGITYDDPLISRFHPQVVR